ncbi:MAG: hypothetical protein QOF51_3570 [Chloroflexota bacterium]|nr:hypothetical protein [Chloroflexota bacterium]
MRPLSASQPMPRRELYAGSPPTASSAMTAFTTATSPPDNRQARGELRHVIAPRNGAGPLRWSRQHSRATQERHSHSWMWWIAVVESGVSRATGPLNWLVYAVMLGENQCGIDGSSWV